MNVSVIVQVPESQYCREDGVRKINLPRRKATVLFEKRFIWTVVLLLC